MDGFRIGVPREALADVNSVVLNAFKLAIKLLASLGATIVENIRFSSIKE